MTERRDAGKGVSLIIVGFESEGLALRGALEWWSYVVETRFVVRKGLLDILAGRAPTREYVVLSCHGSEGNILVPYQRSLRPQDLAGLVHLPGKVVVVTGCETGLDPLAEAFLAGGCAAYIAPAGSPDGDASLMFALALFYHLGRGKPLTEAVEAARGIDEGTGLFCCRAGPAHVGL